MVQILFKKYESFMEYFTWRNYFLLKVKRASLAAQRLKHLPAMQKTWVFFLQKIPESGRSPGEGNGNPLQYSCLENPMDGGAWWATVHWVAKSQILLSNLTNLTVKKDHESTHKNDLFFSFIMNYLTKGWLFIVLFLQNYITLSTFQIFT